MTVAGGFWTQHGVHAAILLAPVLVVAGVGVALDARRWLRTNGLSASPMTVLAAVLSVVAAATHLVVCPEHFQEATLYGFFFAGSAAAQLVWPVLAIRRPRSWVWQWAIVGNLAVVALWLVTRTAGIPFGPEAGEVEPIGALDLLASVTEIGIAACCFRLLRTDTTARQRAVPA